MSAPESAARSAAPVVVLGVSRSGTTLLKEMLDRHSALAIPTESYFVPQLWARHGPRPQREAFLADVARLARIAEWGVTPRMVAERLPAKPTFAAAVAAIYRAYADARGKPRFGDKTPAYMQRLDLLEVAFPGALYVHLVRDGRDAALSLLAMRRRPRFNWARPRGRAPLRGDDRGRPLRRAPLRGSRRGTRASPARGLRLPQPPVGACVARVPPRRRSGTAARPPEAGGAARAGALALARGVEPGTAGTLRGRRRRDALHLRLRASLPAALRPRPRARRRRAGRARGSDGDLGRSARRRSQEPGLARAPGLHPADSAAGRTLR
jgi:hypothetical protein